MTKLGNAKLESRNNAPLPNPYPSYSKTAYRNASLVLGRLSKAY